MISDPTKRFSGLVDRYVKYRPGYPEAVIRFLRESCSLQPGARAADVGSGTGIFTGLLLNQEFQVYAVEPNKDMQHAARQQFHNNKNFNAVDGSAEATTLDACSVDLITCAQAFHWFNQDAARIEFNRILKPGGHAALIWNNRQTDNDNFAVAYENLLKQDAIDYNKVNHRNVSDVDFKAFFKEGRYQKATFANEQKFDETGLTGRAFSSSYVPREETPDGQKFKKLLGDMFVRYNKDGDVSFLYNTEVYLGEV